MLPNGRYENDAEHSWSVAALTLAFLDHYPHLDREKCLRYAITHDLGELYAGDVSSFAPEHVRAAKVHKERDSMLALAGKDPLGTSGALYTSWHQYEQRTDEESHFVYEIDKLAPIISNASLALKSWKEMRVTYEKVRENKYQTVSNRFGFHALLEYYLDMGRAKDLFYTE